MLPYLLAALPSPRLGEVPEVDSDTFLSTCRGFLNEQRMQELAAAAGLAAAPPADRLGPAARAWRARAGVVEDEIVAARCARDGRDPAPHLSEVAGVRIDVRQAVTAAFERPDPAARERALDTLRWRLAGELGQAAPLGFAELLARAVQLGIAWRWAAWDADAGWATLEAHLRRIEREASSEADEAAPAAAGGRSREVGDG
jgi:hypothetical protein